MLPPPPVFVYFGTDTGKGAARESTSRASTWRPASLLPGARRATARPSFMALSPARNGQKRFLYAVNAVNDPAATVTTFVWILQRAPSASLARSPRVGPGQPMSRSMRLAMRPSSPTTSAAPSLPIRVQPDGTLGQPVDSIDFKDTRSSARAARTLLGRISPTPTAPRFRPTIAFWWSAIWAAMPSQSLSSTARPAT